MNFGQLSRRSLLKQAALSVTAAAGTACCAGATDAKAQPDFKPAFPVVDYHVHLSGALTIDKAVALANMRGVKFGIVEHPAPDGKIADDDAKRQWLSRAKLLTRRRGKTGRSTAGATMPSKNSRVVQEHYVIRGD